MSACVHVRVLAVGIVACVLLTGCGQSGPLTLPEETSETEVQSDENPQNDEQEEDEQE
ncbi:MAG: lipoprotein [Gammaproteobacteria bacterium]|nr:lipoprotein [Gammaproteobacteria bacterium]MDH3505507.1 lipoprotein [Gammaproteobacteria bacterium]